MAARRHRIWPLDCLHFAFFGAHLVLQVSTYGRMEDWGWWLAFDLAAPAALLLIIARSGRGHPRADALLRLAHGCVAIPLVFTQVGLTIKALGLPDHAVFLEKMDRFLFLGANPLEMIQTIARPVLTEVMQWAYTAYILLPPATALLLAFKGSPQMIARSLFSMLAIIYLSYIGYYLVPAMGPNIHNNLGPILPIDEQVRSLYTFSSRLPGVWLTDWLRREMFTWELTKKDCFPSGHTAIAVACVCYGFRIGRVWGLLFLPVCVGVVLSTVYLRYHYVVDVIAGMALALVAVTWVERLHRRFERVLFSDLPADASGSGR